MINYYQILGLNENASQEDIKTAFKKKAVLYHPDKHQGDASMEETFKQINLAHQTLSNAYKKSNYDLMLRHGSPEPTFERPVYRPEYPPVRPWHRTGQRRGPFIKRPKFTSKENLWGTLYAFLFAFSMAFIIKVGIWVNDYYQEQEMQQLLTQRRELYTQARSSFADGELKLSLDVLVGMGHFFRSELDIRDYKDQLILDIRRRGDRNLKKGNYQAASGFYHILEQFPMSTTLSFLKKKAQVEIGLGNSEKAVEIYQMLYLNGYRSSSFYYEMGSLYEVGLKDYKMALNYFKVGAKKASSDYEATIGKAYPIVINANMIPLIHYHIYIKLAEMYLQTGNYLDAVNSVQWTREIWPDSLINYEIAAKGYFALGNTEAYHQTTREARKIDPSFKIEVAVE